jgi:hypothetical protein
MNKEYKIIIEIFHWKNILKIRNFLIGIDNKTKYIGYVQQVEDVNMPVFFINLKYAKTQTVIDVISAIFHELGHIKYKTYLWKPIKANKYRSEYLAETFALKQLKKYFPIQYTQHVKSWKKTLADKNWQRRFSLHYEVFSRIKEYKEE